MVHFNILISHQYFEGIVSTRLLSEPPLKIVIKHRKFIGHANIPRTPLRCFKAKWVTFTHSQFVLLLLTLQVRFLHICVSLLSYIRKIFLLSSFFYALKKLKLKHFQLHLRFSHMTWKWFLGITTSYWYSMSHMHHERRGSFFI